MRYRNVIMIGCSPRPQGEEIMHGIPAHLHELHRRVGVVWHHLCCNERVRLWRDRCALNLA
eukprot:16441872-Heterocapsa_arctica.AAC.2